MHSCGLVPRVTVPLTVPAEMLPHVMTGLEKVNTIASSPLVPPLRHSTPGLPSLGSGKSNVPALPCAFRDATLTSSMFGVWHCGNLKLPIRVRQRTGNTSVGAFAARYWLVYQKVQSSTGS